jgi:transcriptional antiterminator RfaH
MEKFWYAIYVKSRCEKKVYASLCKRNIQAYLPLRKVLKQWSDRKKEVEVPLINSYLFVNIDSSQYYDVLSVQGVVRYISFSGKAVPIPEKEITHLQQILEIATDVEVFDSTLEIGDGVVLKSGPFKGFFGKIFEEQKFKFVIQLEQIGYNVFVTVPKKYVSHSAF